MFDIDEFDEIYLNILDKLRWLEYSKRLIIHYLESYTTN